MSGMLGRLDTSPRSSARRGLLALILAATTELGIVVVARAADWPTGAFYTVSALALAILVAITVPIIEPPRTPAPAQADRASLARSGEPRMEDVGIGTTPEEERLVTPTELARELGVERREVIETCMRLGVPIFQSRIDRGVFAAAVAWEGGEGAVTWSLFRSGHLVKSFEDLQEARKTAFQLVYAARDFEHLWLIGYNADGDQVSPAPVHRAAPPVTPPKRRA